MIAAVEFFAGFVSGIAGLLVGSPFDVVKTGHQNTRCIVSAEAAEVSLPTRVSKLAWDSPSSWFAGLLMPFIGLGFLNAILFWSYGLVIRMAHQDREREVDLWTSFLAGAVSGLCGCCVSVPTEYVKVRAQTALSDATSIEIAREIWQEEGVCGFWRGGHVTVAREVLGYGLYFLPYDALRTPICELVHDETIGTLLAGGVAGCIAWLSIFPLDTIKTRIQAGSGPDSQRLLAHTSGASEDSQGTLETFTLVYRTMGFSGFFRGLPVAMVRAFIVNAVIFWVDHEIRLTWR